MASNYQQIATLESTLYELKQQKEEAEKKLPLFRKLMNVADNIDTDSRLESIDRGIKGYKKQKDELPKGWFGKVKDKAAVKKLEDEIVKLSKEKEEVPIKAKQYLERLAKLKEALGIKETISSATAYRLYMDVHFAICNLGKKILMNELHLTNVKDYGLGEPYSIFGDLFFGPAQANLKAQEGFLNTYMRKEDVPSFPDKIIMERAKDLEAIMALRVYDNGKAPEWKIFRKDILLETLNKTYIEQTRSIRSYLKQHGFLRPDEEAECSDEKLKELEKLIQTDPPQAAIALTNLMINKRHRHSFKDIHYFTFLTECEDKGGSIHRYNGKSYSGLFTNYDQESTNTPLINKDRKIGNIKMGSHLCEQRGPCYDELPINSISGINYGHAQGVRLVL